MDQPRRRPVRYAGDLYGAQVGGRLEDMGSFAKYIGGSPTNIACGPARLGLRSAVITREGVDTRGGRQRPDKTNGTAMTKTIRLTAAQAMVRWLSVQHAADGAPFITG
ncbi:MAG: hypothetical protein ACK4GW_12550, partial [Pseudorhodobacter sp.]